MKLNMNDVLADSKELREMSLKNAKLALEQAFAPKIQEIIREKLNTLTAIVENDEMIKKLKRYIV